MHEWGQSFDWAALAFAWLVACAIGLAIYFLPVARLLDSLTESSSRRAPMPWLVVAAREGVSSFDATCSLVQRRWGDNMVEF